MKLSHIAVGGAAGIMSLGLIGIGAHAAFSTTTTSTQTITAGTIDVTLSARCAAPPLTTNGGGQDAGTTCGTVIGHTITLTSVTNVGSSFVSGETDIKMTNKGSLPAHEATLTVNDTPSGTAGRHLANEMSVCLTSDGYVMYNGPLTGSEIALPLATPGNSLAANGGSDMYGVVFYAGTEDTGCGTWTAGLWATWMTGAGTGFSHRTAAPFYKTTTYATPSVSTSLTNNAEGGSDAVSVKFGFTG